jgi:hypothetical protein
VFVGAETARKLYDQLNSMELSTGEQIPLIDATAEGWVLDIDHMIVSPLTFKKHWTKKEVIELFNKSKTARQAGVEYPATSLSSKRFDRILREIVKQIRNANRRSKMDRKPRSVRLPPT